MLQATVTNVFQSSPLSFPLINLRCPSSSSRSTSDVDSPGSSHLVSPLSPCPPVAAFSSATTPPSLASALLIEALADSSILLTLLHVFPIEVLDEALALLRKKRIADKVEHDQSMALVKVEAVARLWTVEQYYDHLRKLEEREKMHRAKNDALNQREVELELVLQKNRESAASKIMKEECDAGSTEISPGAPPTKTRKRKRPTKNRSGKNSSSLPPVANKKKNKETILKSKTCPALPTPSSLLEFILQQNLLILQLLCTKDFTKESIMKIPEGEQATLFDELSEFFNTVQEQENNHVESLSRQWTLEKSRRCNRSRREQKRSLRTQSSGMFTHITSLPSTSSSDDVVPSFLALPCFVPETLTTSSGYSSCSSSYSTTSSSIFPLHPLPPSILATLYPLLITDGMLEQAIIILQQQRRTREAVYQGWKLSANGGAEIPQWILAPVKQAHQDFLTAIDQEEARLLQLLLTRRIVAAINPQSAKTTCVPIDKTKRRRYRKRKATSLVESEQSPTKVRPSLLEFLEDATQVIIRLLGYSEAVTEESPHCINGGTHESSDSMKEDRLESESESLDVSQLASPDSSLPTRLCTRYGTSVLAYCRVTCEQSGTVYFYHKVERESLNDLPEGEEANSEDELEYDRLHPNEQEAFRSDESCDGKFKKVMKRKHEAIDVFEGENVDTLMPHKRRSPGHL